MGTCYEYHNNVTVCECDDGVTGDNCEIVKQCDLDCGDNGTCDSVFNQGKGSNIETFEIDNLNKVLTNRNLYLEFCRCDEGWKGNFCEFDICFNHCIHGICTAVSGIFLFTRSLFFTRTRS